jgi:hypothetical protein
VYFICDETDVLRSAVKDFFVFDNCRDQVRKRNPGETHLANPSLLFHYFKIKPIELYM